MTVVLSRPPERALRPAVLTAVADGLLAQPIVKDLFAPGLSGDDTPLACLAVGRWWTAEGGWTTPPLPRGAEEDVSSALVH